MTDACSSRTASSLPALQHSGTLAQPPCLLEDPHLLSQLLLLELLTASWSLVVFSLGLLRQACVQLVKSQAPEESCTELLVTLFFFNYSPLLSRATSTVSQGVR